MQISLFNCLLVYWQHANDKQNLSNKYWLCLSKLDEMISNEKDVETKSRLSNIYEKINNKSYNKKNAIVDIAEMVEMQDAIDD